MESGRQLRLATLVLGAGIVIYGTSSAIGDGLGVWTGLLLISGVGLIIYHARRPGDRRADVTERDAWIATGCATMCVIGALAAVLALIASRI